MKKPEEMLDVIKTALRSQHITYNTPILKVYLLEWIDELEIELDNSEFECTDDLELATKTIDNLLNNIEDDEDEDEDEELWVWFDDEDEDDEE